MGEGIKNALSARFDKVISIELSKKYYDLCRNKFKKNKNVIILYGSSELLLKDAIGLAKGRITFWLDGHWSGGDTAKGSHEVPILQELEQIEKAGRKNDIILIDDLEQIIESGIKEETLITLLTNINEKYIFNKVKGIKNRTTLIAK